MAPSFGRSISFPLSPARSSKPRAAAYHVRSISLPCRSHPLLANLHTHTAAARAWAAALNNHTTASSPSSGLAHIDALLAALAELLLLPEPQAAVRAASDRLLDAFLLLADAHRGFQEALLALRRDAADVRAALRRRDASRLASAARSQRRSEKELARLAAAASSVAVASKRFAGATTTAEETDMATALVDAAAASATASAAVFSAVALVSAAASSSKKTATTFSTPFAKKPETADVEPEKLDELEQCIDECESGSEMVFRSIVGTRVSLLNIRTPAI